MRPEPQPTPGSRLLSDALTVRLTSKGPVVKSARGAIGMLVVMILIAGCSSDGGGVTVSDPWGRTSPSAVTNAAFYMQLEGSDTDDVLVGAESPACTAVELHETRMSDGMMSMQELAGGIPVPAGQTVSLEPGGMHVMCLGLTSPLVEGELAEVQLRFEGTGLVTVNAEIRDS